MRFKTSLGHESSRIRGRLPSAETSESVERFQRNEALASCIRKPLFRSNSDGISKYQYVLNTKTLGVNETFLHGSVALVN